MEVQHTLSGNRFGGVPPAGGGELLGRAGVHGAMGPGGVAVAAVQAAGGWRPGIGGIMQRPYSKDRGFCVFWDYATGLPKRSGSKVVGKVIRCPAGRNLPRRLDSHTPACVGGVCTWYLLFWWCLSLSGFRGSIRPVWFGVFLL